MFDIRLREALLDDIILSGLSPGLLDIVTGLLIIS